MTKQENGLVVGKRKINTLTKQSQKVKASLSQQKSQSSVLYLLPTNDCNSIEVFGASRHHVAQESVVYGQVNIFVKNKENFEDYFFKSAKPIQLKSEIIRIHLSKTLFVMDIASLGTTLHLATLVENAYTLCC